MSANNQIVVAPLPEDLDRWAVWHDSCVDNPFDFGQNPIGIYDDLEDAMIRAHEECMNYTVEYGVNFIPRKHVPAYGKVRDSEYPEYEYLGVVAAT